MDTKVKMRFVIGILIALILVLIAVVFVKYIAPKGEREQQASAVRVEVIEVKRERVPDVLTFTGELQPEQRATITANVSGLLERMQVQGGDYVEEGAVLAQIEQDDYLLALQAAEVGLVADSIGQREKNEMFYEEFFSFLLR